MKMRYFPDTDTVYIVFRDGEVHETKEISENVYIDVDEAGNLIAMTVEHAKGGSELWEFSYQEVRREIA